MRPLPDEGLARGSDGRLRCSLPPDDPLFCRYHDTEWGRPVASDQAFFEKVCLEAFQSGLSWQLILHRRVAFREAFDDFDIERVARFDTARIESLLNNPQIIRNRRKIEAAVHNASCALRLQDECASLAGFFWQYEPADGERPTVVTQAWLASNTVSASSKRLAQALKKRQWKFVGPTTLHALMQAYGLVNDHVHGCEVRDAVEAERAAFVRPRA